MSNVRYDFNILSKVYTKNKDKAISGETRAQMTRVPREDDTNVIIDDIGEVMGRVYGN